MKELAALVVFAIAVAALPLFVTSGFALNIVIMTLYAALLGKPGTFLPGSAGSSRSDTPCSSAPAPMRRRCCR